MTVERDRWQCLVVLLELGKECRGLYLCLAKWKCLELALTYCTLLPIQESCKSPPPADARNRLIFSLRWRKKKCLSTCIRSSMLRTREAFSLSGVSGERVSERNRQGRRGKVNEAVSLVREPFHHSLCCETVPLLWLSDANCSEESNLLSAVYWMPPWEDLRQHKMGSFA